MKYETPELTALVAINAIQNSLSSKSFQKQADFIQPGSPAGNEIGHGYADWE